MSRRLFGTDGIRGLAGHEPLTPETAVALGRAVAARLKSLEARPSIVVGRDTRLSGDMLESAFSAGLCAGGVDVHSLGVLPTPAVACLTRVLGANAGAMISASHNPFQDNGIKLFAADGFKLSDAMELEIEQSLEAPSGLGDRLTGAELGRVQGEPGIGERYLSHLLSAVPAGVDLAGMKVVVDAGNGAAFRLGVEVFERLGASVEAIGNTPDGTNINRDLGALHPDSLQEAVRRSGAALGLALDGDADRAILVDEQGEIRDGDACLAICGSALLEDGRLPGRTVVATQMSNLGLEHFFAQRGIRLLRTQVGDRYVVEAMRAGNHPLGGEQSGHVIFLEHATTGDGLLTALMIASIMKLRRRPLSSLVEHLKRFPQVLLNVRLKVRKPLDSLPGVMVAIQEAERALGSEGRVLVRFSGTEPLARVMIEGREPAHIRTLAQRIIDEIALELA